MVVIEKAGCLLLIRVIASGRVPGHKPILRISIALGARPAAVKMHHGAHLWLLRFRSVEGVIDGKKMPFRQVVDPLHQNGFPTPSLEGRTGARIAVSPESG